jgi:uncharacterized membrane protein YphA (DoxX/SURF4 family)
MSPKAFFATDTGPGSTSFGLLVLRVAALSLFLRHGLEKLTGKYAPHSEPLWSRQ